MFPAALTPKYSWIILSFIFLFSTLPATWAKPARVVAGVDVHELFLLFLGGAQSLVSILLSL